jgi:hypothetical protein
MFQTHQRFATVRHTARAMARSTNGRRDDLAYAPNKLHGDEIETAGGTSFQPAQPHE